MRILKALAAVLAGILLLALPAVAIPQAPKDPGTQGCASPKGEANPEADKGTDAEKKEEGEKKVETAEEEPCPVPEEQQQPEQRNALNELLSQLGL